MTSSDKHDSKAVAAQESSLLRKFWEAAEVGRPSQQEFGEKYGIGGQSAVGNFLHGRSLLSMKAGLGFSRGLGVPLASFSPRLALEAMGIASVTSSEPVVISSVQSLYMPVQALQPPLLSELRVNTDGHVEQTLSVRTEKAAVNVFSQDSNAYAARIRGDGFFPRYRAGEFLILSKSAERVQGADILVQVEGGPLLLMQFNWAREDEMQLLPLNGSGSPLTLPMADIAWSECVLAVANIGSLQANPEKTSWPR